MAENPVTGPWLTAFMNKTRRPKVDFVTVHWYKGVDYTLFRKDLEAVWTAYGLPIWVTEYAPQTHASAVEDPEKFTQEQVDKFILKTSEWMEKTSYIERYAWHDSAIGSSSLFTQKDNGDLTATGLTYSRQNKLVS